MKKGQVSVELMIVVAFVLALFIPLLLVTYYKIGELNEDLMRVQAEVAVSRISTTIDSIGRMGLGSSIILDVYLPPKSTLEFNPEGGGTEIILTLRLISGETEIVANSWYPVITDIFPDDELQGGVNYRFDVTSVGNKKVFVGIHN